MATESDWSPTDSFSRVSKPQFLISDNAFYPIKDDLPSSEGRRPHPHPPIAEAVIRPLEDRISALEKSRNDLEGLIGQVKAASKPRKEELLRSNTDLLTHLSYKVQVMSESVASLKGKVHGMEERSNEHRSTVSRLEKSLSNIETNVLPTQDNVLSKQSNELLMVRDVIADLRDKLENQQRMKYRNNNDNADELNSKLLSMKNTIDRMSEKQNRTEKELERAMQRRREDEEEREEQMKRLIKDVCHKIINEEMQGKMNRVEKRLADNRVEEDEGKGVVVGDPTQRKTHEKSAKNSQENGKGRSGDDVTRLQEQLKAEKARTNGSLQKLNDAMLRVTEKQMEEQKVNQEKFQAEVITRQKFECEILKRLKECDEKTTKVSEQMEEMGNKREKLKAYILHQMETLDSARVKALDDLNDKVNLLAKKRASSKSDGGDQKSKESADDSSNRLLRQDIRKIQDSLKDIESKLHSNAKRIDECQSNMKDANRHNSLRRDAQPRTLDHVTNKIKAGDDRNDNDDDDDDNKTKKKSYPTKDDVEKLQKQVNQLLEAEKQDKVDRDKIRSLANSIQLLKGLVAMKIQHEEKAREEAFDHLQKQIDNVEDSIEKLKTSQIGDEEYDDDDGDKEGQGTGSSGAKGDGGKDGKRSGAGERGNDAGGTKKPSRKRYDE